MDKQFFEMLEEAEKIRAECRRTGNIGPHAGHMLKMIEYGTTRGFFTGSVLDGTASEEYLNYCAEMSAYSLEVIYNEEIGSVLTLPIERKLDIIRHATEKAATEIKFVAKHGRLPQEGEVSDDNHEPRFEYRT